MQNKIIDSMMGNGLGGPLGFMSYSSIILTVLLIMIIVVILLTYNKYNERLTNIDKELKETRKAVEEIKRNLEEI